MNKALVLLSGGMKSAIVLYMAKRYNPHVEAILFGCHYTPQRKRDCAKKLAEQAGVKLHEYPTNCAESERPIQCLPLRQLSQVSLQPSWSLFYLSSEYYQLSRSLRKVSELGFRELYSGSRHALNGSLKHYLGVDSKSTVVLPLSGMTNHQVVEMAKELDRGGECDMSQILRDTWSCEHDFKSRRPCNDCRGCINRALGFTAAGLPDPFIVQCQIQGTYPNHWLNSGLHPKFANSADLAQYL